IQSVLRQSRFKASNFERLVRQRLQLQALKMLVQTFGYMRRRCGWNPDEIALFAGQRALEHGYGLPIHAGDEGIESKGARRIFIRQAPPDKHRRLRSLHGPEVSICYAID